MRIIFFDSIKHLKQISIFIFILVGLGCSTHKSKTEQANKTNSGTKRFAYCTNEDRKKNIKTFYKWGEIVCAKDTLGHHSGEILKIDFVIENKDSSDPYEYGYQVLERNKDGQLIEVVRLRRDEDAYWSETPFVRIREHQYFSDLDNDGFDEFAIFPFSPGSATYGTVRIFSLKEKMTFWGYGKIQFEEGDSHVLLNCPACSKLNPDACEKCQ